MVHAFTRKNDRISLRLISQSEIISGNATYRAKHTLWDTGATNTCISKKVASDLGLVPTGITSVLTASGKMDVKEYRIDIKLQNENIYLKNAYVLDSNIEEQGIDLLIGMNIITKGDFAVSNYDKKTVFSFRIPSVECTDYTKLEHGRKNHILSHKRK